MVNEKDSLGKNLMAKIIHNIGDLRLKSENVTAVEEAQEILMELENTLRPLDNGVGLAAIQIGKAKRIGAIKKDNGSFIHLINSELIEAIDEFVFVNEGCLSFPNEFRNTKRYKQVIIKNQRIEGGKFEDEILSFYYSKDDEPGNDGLVAIAVQHELEHFAGELIIDHNIINAPIVRTEQKTGRNDKCPCGSGRKYKKCCGK